MNRAGHFRRAEELADDAVHALARADQHAALRKIARDDAHMFLRAALVHATLACAPLDVELMIEQETRRAAEAAKSAAGHPKPGPPGASS